MLIRAQRLNIYLLLAAVICWMSGCTGPEHAKKKQAATLAIHLETSAHSGEKASKISVFRASPIELTVEKEPFITEAFISEAHVISVMDGFGVTIQLDRRGTLLLEQYTAGNLGRHFVIEVRFGKDLEQQRWLAAPVINHRISNGVLTFTPDATREEADQIVLGLNNVAKKVHAESPF
jgi:preprotein translocase subunit SecD